MYSVIPATERQASERSAYREGKRESIFSFYYYNNYEIAKSVATKQSRISFATPFCFAKPERLSDHLS
jgi:hypothetical protein